MYRLQHALLALALLCVLVAGAGCHRDAPTHTLGTASSLAINVTVAGITTSADNGSSVQAGAGAIATFTLAGAPSNLKFWSIVATRTSDGVVLGSSTQAAAASTSIAMPPSPATVNITVSDASPPSTIGPYPSVVFSIVVTVGPLQTTATVVSGQTYAILPTDIVRMDTSNSADAGGLKVVLPSNPGNQQIITTCWLGWATSPVPPTVCASAVDGGAVMQPYSGQAASGAAGMTTWTAITTPGTCPSWKWDGTEWVIQ